MNLTEAEMKLAIVAGICVAVRRFEPSHVTVEFRPEDPDSGRPALCQIETSDESPAGRRCIQSVGFPQSLDDCIAVAVAVVADLVSSHGSTPMYQ